MNLKNFISLFNDAKLEGSCATYTPNVVWRRGFNNKSTKEPEQEADVDKPYSKIGKLEMENDFLNKSLKNIAKPHHMKTYLISIFFLAQVSLVSGQACSPTLAELYDFNIGSVFQYRTITSTSNGGNPGYHNVVEKYTVTDKWKANDTIGYIRNGIRQSYTEYETNFEPVIKQSSDFIDTIYVIDSSSHLLNACDSQLVYLGLENNFYSLIVIDSVDGMSSKRIGGLIDGKNNLFQYDSNDSLIEVIGYDYEQIFLKGLGLKKQSRLIFEWSEDIILEGYVFDMDTTGTIWSDSDFTVSVDKITNSQSIRFFPTIVTDNLINIEHEKDYSDLKIYSINGRLQNFQSLNSKQIKLINPVEGVYIIRLLYDNNYITQKILIQ